MLVVGGFLLTYDQLHQLGRRRGLQIEGGKAHILNNHSLERGIHCIHALPVCHPRTTVEVPRILICTRRRDDHIVRLADCKPFEINEDDLKVEKWLEHNGIMGAPFVAVPDPFLKYDENGNDCD